MFVVLRHEQASGTHWDLMVERASGGALRSWRLAQNPCRVGWHEIAAESIGDHRRAYLTHEGPVGGGRGAVFREDAGKGELLADNPNGAAAVELHGISLVGRFELAQTDAGVVLRRCAAAAACGKFAAGGSPMNEALSRLIDHVRELNTLRAIDGLLDWDQETYMPPSGAEDRAAQSALMAGLAHERLTAPVLGDWLASAESGGLADDRQRAIVREVRREHERAIRVPNSLVRELAAATALAKPAWAAARRESNFTAFAPHFQRVLDLKKQFADCIGWSAERYDALLDEYEPGARSAEVAAVFAGVREQLVPLVRRIAQAPRRPDDTVLRRPVTIENQAAFCRLVAESFGFDFQAGRIDTTVHPFCSGITPRDVRLTNRFDVNYLPMALFGIMHETGHGLYEQGFEPTFTGTPVARAVSLGIHESQSRLWENLIGRSLPFWRHFFPVMQQTCGGFGDVSLEAWHFAVNRVEPSFIRVEADEVTYGLHIMLRFEIERQLLSGALAVPDVPAAWNQQMHDLLGIRPPDDAHGCLQDIHWSSGLFGYFPTYLLGNLFGAQFFEAARTALPDLDAQAAAGRFGALREWLRENIHRHGQTYRAEELVRRVTGRPLSAEPFARYLREKFEPLYGLA